MEQEKAILVACQFPGETEDDCRASLEELEALAKTAGALVVQAVMQKREMPEPATYIGKGKLDELKAIIAETSAELVIFNDELSPSQTRNLSDVLETKIIDRTRLILDIFARRAKSREGQLQVELAQLEYLLPRLSGIGKELSRLGGGIGTRGPGETKLETDRRHLLKRIHDIKNQLKKYVEHRERYRKKGKKGPVPGSFNRLYQCRKINPIQPINQGGIFCSGPAFCYPRSSGPPPGSSLRLSDPVKRYRRFY
jgi:GTP-binding protein HflX (EC 3.1.5.-)